MAMVAEVCSASRIMTTAGEQEDIICVRDYKLYITTDDISTYINLNNIIFIEKDIERNRLIINMMNPDEISYLIGVLCNRLYVYFDIYKLQVLDELGFVPFYDDNDVIMGYMNPTSILFAKDLDRDTNTYTCITDCIIVEKSRYAYDSTGKQINVLGCYKIKNTKQQLMEKMILFNRNRVS